MVTVAATENTPHLVIPDTARPDMGQAMVQATVPAMVDLDMDLDMDQAMVQVTATDLATAAMVGMEATATLW